MIISGRCISHPALNFSIMTDRCVFLSLRYLTNNSIVVIKPQMYSFPAQPRNFYNNMSHEKKRQTSIPANSNHDVNTRQTSIPERWEINELSIRIIYRREERYQYSTLYKWMDESIKSDHGTIIFLIMRTFYTREAFIYLK